MTDSRWARVLRLRARSLFRRAAVERDLARELQSHIDLQVDDYVARGMSLEQARQAALREFGGIARFQDDVRDTWHVSLLGDLRRDLRYAWRGLSRRPLLLVVSILSIGLGVAVNTTVFALAKTLFLAPPSARDAGRLVNIRSARSSHASYEQWRVLSTSGALAGLAGYQIESEVNWLRGDAAVTLVPMLVTANFFDVVGVPVARGRAFTAAEARAELDPRVVVVSDGFWRSALGADASVNGRSITLNGRPYTIIGVLAPHIRGTFGYGSAPEVYLPLSKTLVPYLADPGAPVVQLVGRLDDDQTVAEGRAAFTAAARRAERTMASPADTGFARLEVFAPARGLSTDWYAVRWTGELVVPASGVRRLGVEGSDGWRLWVGDSLILDNWRKQSHRALLADVTLPPGSTHSLRLEYQETTGNARVRLVWDAGIQADWRPSVDSAVAVARASDVAVVVAGIEEGEFRDRASLSLPGHQEALIEAVERGVAVRALIAHTNRGGESKLRKLESRMLKAGVTLSRTADDMVRYHGKLLVIDQRQAFVLGFNYTHQDVAKSRSFGLVTRNRKIVRDIMKVIEADHNRVATSTSSSRVVVSPENARELLADFIRKARRELLIYDGDTEIARAGFGVKGGRGSDNDNDH